MQKINATGIGADIFDTIWGFIAEVCGLYEIDSGTLLEISWKREDGFIVKWENGLEIMKNLNAKEVRALTEKWEKVIS